MEIPIDSVLVYESSWNEWESAASVEIYLKEDELFCCEHEDSSCGRSRDDIRKVSWEEAIQLVEEWESGD
jgi:hypothetical protein